MEGAYSKHHSFFFNLTISQDYIIKGKDIVSYMELKKTNHFQNLDKQKHVQIFEA